MLILVTGANGYIGSKVVTKLLDMGNEVVAVDLFCDHLDPRCHFIKADIFNPNEPLPIEKCPDVCLHLAWRNGFVHDSFTHMEDLSNHFTFLRTMIERGVKHIAVMGSAHEIGYYEGAVTSDTPTNPVSFYGIAKDSLRKAAEILCQKYNVTFQWLRAYYIYGDDTFGNSIFCKIRSAEKNGVDLFPFTSGKNKFDFLSIDELTEQICFAVTQKSVVGIINICSGKPVALGDMVERYLKQNNLKIKLDYGKFPEKKSESPCIYGDPSKINQIMAQKQRLVLITGGSGQVAYDCIKELKCRGYSNVRAVDVGELDVSNEAAVKSFFQKERPSVVIHCAAWTAVDKAEQFPDAVMRVNALGTKYIAEACKDVGAAMVYFSTDYVFNGKGETPFEVNSPKDGLSVYGKSKSLGEDYVIQTLSSYFIVRISWVFGLNGRNFLKAILNLATSGAKEITVVNDQVGSITYSVDLARLIVDMIETDRYGVYHATNEGFVSRSDLVRELLNQAGCPVPIKEVTTEEYNQMVPAQADRPLNSRLDKSSLDRGGFARLPDWKNAISRFLIELNMQTKKGDKK